MSRVDLRTRIGTAILVVAALSVGRVVTDNLPGKDAFERPFTSEVALGETASLRTGDVTVTGVRGGTRLDLVPYSRLTPGVWVAVDYTWLPRQGTEALGSVAIRSTGGQRWVATLGRNVSACGASVPGLPVRCQAVIELPPELVPGASLELSPVLGRPEYDSRAVVDLRLDQATVDRWLADKKPIPQPKPTLGAS